MTFIDRGHQLGLSMPTFTVSSFGARFLSASDPRVLFGLGEVERVDALEVRWPSGHVDRVTDVPIDRYVRLTEGGSLGPVAADPEEKKE